MKKLAILLSFFLVGCASTHGSFITEHHDAWIDGHNTDSEFADKEGLLFCRANIEENGLANPTCFEAKFEEYEDEKERLEKQKKREEKPKKKETSDTEQE